VVAHVAEKDPKIGDPLMDELISFAWGTSNIWAWLAKGTGIITLDLSTQIPSLKESAAAFWAPWRRP
jgi:hypothetical protein